MTNLNPALTTLRLDTRPVASTYLKIRNWLNLLTGSAPSMRISLSGWVKFKTFSMMQLGVVTAAKNFQVLNPIVKFVFVNMVNYFTWRKFSSKTLFHYQALLSKFLAIYRLHLIAMNIYPSHNSSIVMINFGMSISKDILVGVS